LKELRFHDLRHEAVTRLFEKGLNPIEVGMVSRHKTLSMLQKYTNLRPEELVAKLA
jgi:integrase